MNKTVKIKLLKGLKEGNIPIDNLSLHLAAIGLTETLITLWQEIKPGIYQHKDSGRILKEVEPIKVIKSGEVIIRINLFSDNGTKVPLLASSEKDIDLE